MGLKPLTSSAMAAAFSFGVKESSRFSKTLISGLIIENQVIREIDLKSVMEQSHGSTLSRSLMWKWRKQFDDNTHNHKSWGVGLSNATAQILNTPQRLGLLWCCWEMVDLLGGKDYQKEVRSLGAWPCRRYVDPGTLPSFSLHPICC